MKNISVITVIAVLIFALSACQRQVESLSIESDAGMTVQSTGKMTDATQDSSAPISFSAGNQTTAMIATTDAIRTEFPFTTITPFPETEGIPPTQALVTTIESYSLMQTEVVTKIISTPQTTTTKASVQTTTPTPTTSQASMTTIPATTRLPAATIPVTTVSSVTTIRPVTTAEPVQTQSPEFSDAPQSITQAEHERIIAEVCAYADSYESKGFTFEWKESMEFGWESGYMGTPRVRYEGIDGVIGMLKHHIDLIYKTSTDPLYGLTSTHMTYKVEQVTVDGDLAYVVLYGG